MPLQVSYGVILSLKHLHCKYIRFLSLHFNVFLHIPLRGMQCLRILMQLPHYLQIE